MKKNFIYHPFKTGIVLLMMMLCCSSANARDWYELHQLSESELAVKVAEFQKKLDQQPNDVEMLKALGIAYHIMAIKDVQTYAPIAVKYLSAAYDQNKTDYVALCYLGSATTMMAQTTDNLMEKGSYANRGIAYMDKAVRKNPDNVSIRMTRAYNSRSLPEFLGRESIAIEDFEHLAEMIEKDPSSLSIQKEVYENLTELYEKNGEKQKSETYRQLANER